MNQLKKKNRRELDSILNTLITSSLFISVSVTN